MLGLLELLGILSVLKAKAFVERSKCLYYLLTLPQIIEMGGKTTAQTGEGKERDAQPLLLPWQSQSAMAEASLFRARVHVASLQHLSWRYSIATEQLLPSL